jgi:predicted nucleic acid-binding protein
MTIFADTFYFVGLLNRRDQSHARCVSFARTFQGLAVTTGYVLVELADALSSPVTRIQTAAFIAQVQTRPEVRVIPTTEELFQRGLKRYRERADKEWSLTDCISFVVMEDLDLSEAATGDQHFVQAGFRVLL